MNGLVIMATALAGIFVQPAGRPCSPGDVRVEKPEPGDPDEAGIIWSHPDNPQMVAARNRARAELPQFFERMANPAADESYFTVKFDLGEGEYIWADRLNYQGGRLRGRLTNTPLNPDFVLYQIVEIPETAIYDWGYFRGRVMQGNYSTRVQLEHMPPEDAREIRAAFGW